MRASPAHELGAVAISTALERAKVEGGEVNEVILGQILAAGQGQNPARQAAMKAGIPQEATSFGGSTSLRLGPARRCAGHAADCQWRCRHHRRGRQESMSQAPHVAYLRSGQKMGDLKMMDSMLKDGLIDAFHGYHMGNTARERRRAAGS